MFVPATILAGSMAMAHPGTAPCPNVAQRSARPAVQVTVDYHWVFAIPAGERRARWHRRNGPHPHANNPAYIWVPAHVNGRGRNRHVVPGHWKVRPHTHAPPRR